MDPVSQPLVSIGMPTWRRPDGLRRALDCALSQSWSNLEIIVSENADGDAPGYPFMHEVCAADPRIRYVRQHENIGAQGNFRYVLSEARGEYFIWFADDDLCEDNYVESLMDAFARHPQAVACCSDIKVIDENDQEVRIEHLASLYREGDWSNKRCLFFHYPLSNVFYAIYGLYKTSVLREGQHLIKPGWKGHNTNTEIPLLAWLATKGEIIAIPKAPKLYRIHSESVYSREAEKLSSSTALMIKLQIRGQLLAITFSSGLSVSGKLSLLASTLIPRMGKLWSRWTS